MVDLLDLLSLTPTILARGGQRHRCREMIVDVQNRTPGNSVKLILIEERRRDSAHQVNRVFRTESEGHLDEMCIPPKQVLQHVEFIVFRSRHELRLEVQGALVVGEPERDELFLLAGESKEPSMRCSPIRDFRLFEGDERTVSFEFSRRPLIDECHNVLTLFGFRAFDARHGVSRSGQRAARCHQDTQRRSGPSRGMGRHQQGSPARARPPVDHTDNLDDAHPKRVPHCGHPRAPLNDEVEDDLSTGEKEEDRDEQHSRETKRE